MTLVSGIYVSQLESETRRLKQLVQGYTRQIKCLQRRLSKSEVRLHKANKRNSAWHADI